MSRKKDRERLFAKKKTNSTYEGFRGREREPKIEVKSVRCTICDYVRNVPVDTPEEGFICSRCAEKEIKI